MSHHFKENFTMFSSIFSWWPWVFPVNPFFFATTPRPGLFQFWKAHFVYPTTNSSAGPEHTCFPVQSWWMAVMNSLFDQKMTFTKFRISTPLLVTVKNLEVVCKKQSGIEVKSSLFSVAVVYLVFVCNSVVDLFYPDSSPWGHGMMQTLLLEEVACKYFLMAFHQKKRKHNSAPSSGPWF